MWPKGWPCVEATGVRFGSLADISAELGMSALPPKADMLIVGIDVCYVPNSRHWVAPSIP